MAQINCGITAPITNDACEFAQGGVSRIAFANMPKERPVFAYDADCANLVESAAWKESGDGVFYEIEVNDGSASFTSTMGVASNGGKYLTNSITGSIGFIDCKTLEQIRGLILGKFICKIEMNNGQIFVVGGLGRGLSATTFEVNSGASVEDGFGINFTFSCVEPGTPLMLETWDAIDNK